MTARSEADREELMRSYRAAAQQRDEVECIRLLKALHSIDPGNRDWLVDLERFQRKRAATLEKRCLQALDGRKTLEVWQTLDYLASEGGLAVSPELKRRLHEYLSEASRREGASAGRALLDDLRRFFDANDYENTHRTLKVCKDLVALDLYELQERDGELIRKADVWVHREQRQRADHKAFEETLAVLRSEIENGEQPDAVQGLLDTLARFEWSVPQETAADARQAIAARRKRLAGRRRQRTAARVGVVVSVVAGMGTLFWVIERRQAQREWAGRLQQAFESNDFPVFVKEKSAMQRDRRALFGNGVSSAAVVREWLQREKELERTYEERTMRLLAILESLARIREGGFSDPGPTIDGLLVAGRGLATTPQDLQRIIDFEKARVAANDAESQRGVKTIDEILAAMQETDSASFDERQRLAGRTVELLERIRNIDPVSTEWKSEIEKRAKTIAELKASLDETSRGLTELGKSRSLDSYLDAGAAFMAAFPDDSLSGRLRAILENRENYTGLAEVLPSSAYRRGSARLPFESLAGDKLYPMAILENPFWGGLVARLEKLDRLLSRRWPDTQKSIHSLQDDRYLLALYQYEYKATGNRVFVDGPFTDTRDGYVYMPSPFDTVPEFKLQRVAEADITDLQRMPHCVFLETMMTEAQKLDSGEADVFLLRKIKELSEHQGILNPFLKVKLLRFLVGAFNDLGIPKEDTGSVDEILRSLQRMDDEFGGTSWLCVKHASVQTANERSTAILVRHFQDAAWLSNYRFQRHLEAACVGRGARYVGMAGLREPVPELLEGVKPPELWVLRDEGEGPRVAVVAERGRDGSYRPSITLRRGEPLFAPGGEATTRATLAECVENSGVKAFQPEAVLWPPAWPVNRRAL